MSPARAQRSSVRRKSGGDPGGARTLGESVTAMLRSLNVDPETVEWDAWRREDGRWVAGRALRHPQRKGTATFTFDAPGNYVTVDNEDAKWLVGEMVAKGASSPKDDLQQARQRRLQSVPEDELPLGADAIDLVSGTVAATPTWRPRRARREPWHRRPSAAGGEGPVAVRVPVRKRGGPAGTRRGRAEPVLEAPAGKKGRAALPSWDQITSACIKPCSAARYGAFHGSRLSSAGSSLPSPIGPIVSGHVVLRHRRHRFHRALPRQ